MHRRSIVTVDRDLVFAGYSATQSNQCNVNDKEILYGFTKMVNYLKFIQEWQPLIVDQVSSIFSSKTANVRYESSHQQHISGNSLSRCLQTAKRHLDIRL